MSRHRRWKKIRCPRWTCRSLNCIPIESAKKKYDASDALIAGALLFSKLSPAKLALGLVSSTHVSQKVKYVCQDCGKVFEVERTSFGLIDDLIKPDNYK